MIIKIFILCITFLLAGCETIQKVIPPIDAEVSANVLGVETTIGGKIGDGVFKPKIGFEGLGGAIGTGFELTIGKEKDDEESPAASGTSK